MNTRRLTSHADYGICRTRNRIASGVSLGYMVALTAMYAEQPGYWPVRKWFSDDEHGGSAKARQAARAYRDTLLASAPVQRFLQHHYADGQGYCAARKKGQGGTVPSLIGVSVAISQDRPALYFHAQCPKKGKTVKTARGIMRKSVKEALYDGLKWRHKTLGIVNSKTFFSGGNGNVRT